MSIIWVSKRKVDNSNTTYYTCLYLEVKRQSTLINGSYEFELKNFSTEKNKQKKYQQKSASIQIDLAPEDCWWAADKRAIITVTMPEYKVSSYFHGIYWVIYFPLQRKTTGNRAALQCLTFGHSERSSKMCPLEGTKKIAK